MEAEALPIACTLLPGAYKDRLSWIAALNTDALRRHERRDLTLDLRYAPEARERVSQMVRNEQACCSFLTFDLREGADEIRLTVTAPEAAREAADTLFEQFATKAPVASSACGCAVVAEPRQDSEKQPGSKAVGLAAATLATGAVACAVCCVLPFALPATVLAASGGTLAWFASAYAWTTALAALAVVGAWGWIAWQTQRTRRRPAASTIYVMTAATALALVAVLWPSIEGPLVHILTDAS